MVKLPNVIWEETRRPSRGIGVDISPRRGVRWRSIVVCSLSVLWPTDITFWGAPVKAVLQMRASIFSSYKAGTSGYREAEQLKAKPTRVRTRSNIIDGVSVIRSQGMAPLLVVVHE